MQVPKFRDFLTEQDIERKDNPITVAVITKSNPNIKKQKAGETPKKERTISFIQNACEKKGFKCIIINTKHAIITGKDEDKNTLTVYNFDGKDSEHTFIGKDTVCITRAGSIEDEAGLSLISAFQNSSAFMLNTRSAMLTCDNKLTTALLFEKFGIPTPKTAFVSNEKNIDDALKLVGNKFPVILKTLTGTQGIGVVKVESYESLVSTIQALWNHDAEILLQEFMEVPFDVRTFVVDNKIFASTKRIHSKEDFRSNIHRGGSAEPYQLSEDEKDIILKASRISKAYLVGVDHIIYKGKPYVLEINGSPGTGANYKEYTYKDYYSEPEPGNDITGEKLVYRLINWVSKRSHWDRQAASECGWLETVEIDNVGKVRAKFDTGNGADACALHADEILEEGKTIKWKYNGKTFSKPRHGTSKIFRANADGEEPSETRPTILMDITFNGFTYKDIECGLDARPRSGSDLLICRNLMRQMNVSVNPNRTFVLSKRLRPVEKENNIDK
jgi:ribosomal protein S6--L-glutamate ligase